MSDKLIGVAVSGTTAEEVLGRIERSEQSGIHAAWLTTGGARLDSLTTFAAAAGRTQTIKFGTSIVPTFPRHPLVMVQQVQVVAQLVLSQLGFGNCLRKRLRLLPFFRSVDVGGWQPWDENGMWSGWKGKNETSWND